MNEPDRPRRDVSIEEAERMPMTDEELDRMWRRAFDEYVTDSVLRQNVMSLVAEVRRLRAAEANAAATLKGLGYTWGGDATGWTTAWAVSDEAIE